LGAIIPAQAGWILPVPAVSQPVYVYEAAVGFATGSIPSSKGFLLLRPDFKIPLSGGSAGAIDRTDCGASFENLKNTNPNTSFCLRLFINND
jgi:hypothetical protein